MTGIGGYEGSVSKEFAIRPRGVRVVADDKSKTYGQADPRLTAGVHGLLDGDAIAYRLSRERGEDVGEYGIVATGEERQGNYTVTFEGALLRIEAASLDSAEVSVGDQAYTGRPLRPAVAVTLGGLELEEGADYTVSYASNAQPGTAKVSVAGTGNYGGRATGTFGITCPVSRCSVGELEGQTYCGAALTPRPEVRLGSNVLIEGTDYTLAYANNVNAGTARVTVTGRGFYTGSVAREFAVAPREARVVADDKSKAYGEGDPRLTATVDGLVGNDRVAYRLSREDGEDAGEYGIVATGRARQGNYLVAFEDGMLAIERASIAGAIVAVPQQTYTGKALRPAVSVGLDGVGLLPGTDFTVKYRNNTNVGTATATVTGKGNYRGSASARFTIAQAKNPLTVRTAARTAKVSAVRKGAVAVAPLAVAGAKGKLAYARVAKGSSAALSVNPKTGKVTVRRGTKKGSYKIKVKVTAAGNANYRAGSKTVTCTVAVK